MSIRGKLMLSHLLIVLTTCAIIGAGAIIASYEYLKGKTLDMSAQLTYQVLLNVDYRSTEFENTSYRVVASERFIQILRDRRFTGQDLIGDYKAASALGTLASALTISNADILSLYILPIGGSTFQWEKGNPKMSVNELTDEERHMADSLITLVELESSGRLWERTDDSTIHFIRKIIDTDDLSPLGYVVFGIRPDHFRVSLPNSTTLVDPANIVVLNKQRNTIVSALNQDVTPVVDYALEQAQLGRDLRGGSFTYKGASYLMVQSEAQSSKWRVMCVSPLAGLWKDVRMIVVSIATAACFCVLLVGGLAWFLSYSITHKLQFLQKTMQRVEAGDLTVRSEPLGRDEVGMLAISFNNMVVKIQELIQNVAEERLIRQAKEYQVLQTQINPHFLYNTLGSIRCMAQLYEQPEIESMITCLIEILKAALNKKGESWKLSQELAYVDHYIRLQKIRYEDHFRVVYDVAEETEDLFMIGLLLQPLVENAIYHGFELRRTGGVITISSEIENDRLLLRVRDNGGGMSEQTLQRIAARQDQPYASMNSIGVRNVDERIKHCYGDEFGLTITSAVQQGTTVTLILPIIREETKL